MNHLKALSDAATQGGRLPVLRTQDGIVKSLVQWKEFARRDDCLDRMVPSDLRVILSNFPAHRSGDLIHKGDITPEMAAKVLLPIFEKMKRAYEKIAAGKEAQEVEPGTWLYDNMFNAQAFGRELKAIAGGDHD